MNAFNLSLDAFVLRLYLMMLVVIAAGFTGAWLLAFIALPLFLSCLLGINLSLKQCNQWIHARTPRILSWIRNLRTPIHHTA